MTARILFVTGKGGVGKSCVSDALAAAAAQRGHRVLLVRMPGTAPRPCAERIHSSGCTELSSRKRADPPIDRSKVRGSCREIILDDDQALGGFLLRALRFRFLADRLQDSRSFSSVAAVAPGLRDLVRLTTIADLAHTSVCGTVIVVDGPATGHAIPLLTSPTHVLALAPFGPVATDARRARHMLTDANVFTALVVTTPEQLAITEARGLHQRLVAEGFGSPRLIANAVWPRHVRLEDEPALTASDCSADVQRHQRRLHRQERLLGGLESDFGSFARLPFCFVASSEKFLHGVALDSLTESLLETSL